MTANQPPSFVEALLAEREWVRALARTLVSDASRADDLEQETWLAAVRHPPRDLASPRAWLGTVVRNWARRAHRGDERRHAREAASARDESMPSPAEMLARAEAHRRVVDAVLALEEPYRGTVLARFFEDMPPREIAARSGVPVETVRTRLKRGLAQLRVRLESEYGAEGKSWGAALAPLAAKGAVIVKSSTKAGLVAAALLAAIGASVAIVVWNKQDVAPAARPAGDVQHAVAKGTRAPRAIAAKPAEAVPLATGNATVRGEVWFANPEKPAAGVEVAIGDASNQRSVRTDESGRFVAGQLPAGLHGVVRVTADGFAPVVRPLMPLRKDETRDLGFLQLVKPGSAAVTVLSLDGAPLAGVLVEARRTPAGMIINPALVAAEQRDAAAPEAAAMTGADGRVAFETLEPSAWTFLAKKSGLATAYLIDVPIAAGARRDGLTMHLMRGSTLTGRLHDPAGRGVPALRVWANSGWSTKTYASGLLPSAVSDADGRFAVEGLVAGEYAVSVAPPDGPPVAAGRARVPSAAPLDIVIDPRRVVGTVREGPELKPSEGAIVSVLDGSNSAVARSGPDGRYELRVLLPLNNMSTPKVTKPGWVEAADTKPKGYDPDRVDPGIIFRKDGTAERDFVLVAGARVNGRLTCDDAPVRGVHVFLQPRRGQPREAVSGGDGRFEFADLAAGDFVLWAFGEGFGTPAPDANEGTMPFLQGRDVKGMLKVPAGAEVTRDVTLVRHPAQEPPAPATARVRGRVVAPAGAEPRGVWVQAASATGLQWLGYEKAAAWTVAARSAVARDGTFDVEVSSPYGAVGDVLVRAGADGLASKTETVKPPAGSGEPYEATVRLEPLARMAGTVVFDDTGAPAAGVPILLDADERRGWSWPVGRPSIGVIAATTDASGRFVLDDVSAGPHRIEAVPEGRLPARVNADTTQPGAVELRLAPMHAISGTVRFADGRPLARAIVEATAVVEGSSGSPTSGVGTTLEDGTFTVGYLPAGRYQLRVTDGMSFAGIQRVELPNVAADTSGLEITVNVARAIRGTVTGPDGKPVAGAFVDAVPASGHAHGSAESLADGSFEVRGLDDAVYDLVVRPPRPTIWADYGIVMDAHWLGTKLSGVRPPRDDVALRLAAALTIEGVAVDASGQPLKLRCIRAERVGKDGDDALRGSYDRSGAITDDAGHFEVTGLAPGTHRVVALGTPPRPEAFPLLGAERVAAGTRGVRGVLGSFATIAGVVVDENGAPVRGASVVCVDAEGATRNATSAADGTFEVKQLDAGRVFDVHAGAEGKAPAKAERITAGTKDLRLALAAGLVASGRLLDSDGTPIKDAFLTFATDASAIPLRTKTGADGEFRVAGLLPGKYRVSYFGKRGNTFKSWPCGEVEAGSTEVMLRPE